ncbi:cytochrome P450 [Gorgonomyces haynaldii]|nr:cytochrome P450 [Gorgonomyces haynaldii]
MYFAKSDSEQVLVDVEKFQSFQKLQEHVLSQLGITGEYYFKSGVATIYQDLDSLRSAPEVIQVLPVKAIFGPQPMPLVGNIPDLKGNGLDIDENVHKFFEKYPQVVRYWFLTSPIVATNDANNAEVIVRDGEYFTKRIMFPFSVVKTLGGDGLFTSSTEDPKWKLGHAILIPAFSPKAMKAYTHEIYRVASQLRNCFLEMAEKEKDVDVLNWMTNVTFESIGKVGFGFSFGVLDSAEPKPHPFLEAMGYCLSELQNRALTPDIIKALPLPSNLRFNYKIKLMQETVEDVIALRIMNPRKPGEQSDLLDFMLTACDEQGIKMDKQLIRDQVITFLIAGHETTSITLSWALVLLSRHPNWLQRCVEEADATDIGSPDWNPHEVNRFPLIERVIKETLRLYPPVRFISKYCIKDCVLPTGHKVSSGSVTNIAVLSLHRNPQVYPEPLKFNPDRWLPEEEQKRSAYAWLPFSIGARGCIGRQFAVLEAKIVLALILKSFYISIPNPQNIVPMKGVATMRPETFHARFHVREPNSSPRRAPSQPIPVASSSGTPKTRLAVEKNVGRFVPVTVLYGTNTGTALDFAHQVGQMVIDMGFQTRIVAMNDWDAVKQNEFKPSSADQVSDLIIVVTATYNGNPPENADKFDKFLNTMTSKNQKMNGVVYSVFGCGNSEWRTYQQFPKRVDAVFEELGARRVAPIGAGDAHTNDLENSFEIWLAYLWSNMVTEFGLKPSTLPRSTENIEVEGAKYTNLGKIENNNMLRPFNAKIVSSQEQQNVAKSGRSTKFIKISLPEGESFAPGDHLEVFPAQDPELVKRAAQVLQLDLDQVYKIDHVPARVSTRSLLASVQGPYSVRNLLTYYADLTGPVSRTLLKVLGDALLKSPDSAELGQKFHHISAPESKQEFAAFSQNYRTLIEFLEAHKDHVRKLELTDWMAANNVIAPRRYSIANSPTEKGVVALLVGENVEERNKKKYFGLASHFLCTLKPEGPIAVQVKGAQDTFALPKDATQPLIMVAAGTGLAPFLGFLDHRRAQGIKSSLKGGKAATYLIFGCRNQDDYICKAQVESYVADGTLDAVFVAFSRQDGQPKKYVQDVVKEQATLLGGLLTQKNGTVYVCGAGAMSRGVKASLEGVFAAQGKEGFFEKLASGGRFNEDTWG